MRSFSACFAIAGCALAVTGCGGKSQTDQGQLGSHAGSSHSGGAGRAGGAGSAGSQAGGAAAGGGGVGGQSAICESFVDAKPLSVPVLIRNGLKYPIQLGPRMDNCAETPLFQVHDASGNLLPGPGPCRTACDTVLAGAPVGGCLPICPVSKAVTLEPGESILGDWAGLSDVASDLPTECVPQRSDGIDFGTRCDHAQAIPPGTYTFSAQAGTTLDCSQVSADGCNECTPDADGYCTVPDAIVGGPTLTVQAEVEVEPGPGEHEAVSLVFKD